jgi:hypothetical protein
MLEAYLGGFWHMLGDIHVGVLAYGLHILEIWYIKAYLGGFGTCLRHVLEVLAHGLMHILVILGI